MLFIHGIENWDPFVYAITIQIIDTIVFTHTNKILRILFLNLIDTADFHE